MYSIALVDDDIEFLNTLKNYLGKFTDETQAEFSVHTYTSGVDFITNYKPIYDLVIMDIEMPGFNGMETAKELRELDENVVLIFITQIAKYAIEGYSVSAAGYMVKPVDYFDFSFRLKRAMDKIANYPKNKILIFAREQNVSIEAHDISYIEVDKHYLVYHVGEKIYRVRETFGEALKKFEPLGFACCYNGCLVNLRYVKTFDSTSVTVGSKGCADTVLPISRQRRKSFLNVLTDYLK